MNSRTLTIDGASEPRYDPATRSAVLTDPDGRTRTTILDAVGRPTDVEANRAYAATTYHYDDHGLIDTVTLGEGPSARVCATLRTGPLAISS